MRNRKFKKYSALLCVKINLFTAFLLFLLFICSKLFMEKIQNEALFAVNELDNAAGAMVSIILIGGFVGILLISYALLVPLLIPLFSNFRDNLKSLIGLVIVNFGIGYFLFMHFTLQLAFIYLLLVFIGMYFSMYFRHSKRRITEIKG